MLIIQVDPEKLKDNPYQPRRGYKPGKIEEIASSIEQNGLLETPVGRQRNGDVELAFGHIRKRAFQRLKKRNPKKWPTMPVEIREITDQEMVIFALEENLKRSDITPIDLARSVARYFEVFPDATETGLGEKLSMTQGNVSNMRRVMRLPDEILDKIDEGRISFTMARELLIFEGLTAAGADQRWSRKEKGYKKTPKDSKWLMLDAIKSVETPGTVGRYGVCAATVEGMQKAIHSTVQGNFKPLGIGSDYGYSHQDEVLFDTDKAGCKTCESTIKTHPTKSYACLWCTKIDCWEKKQKAHKEKRAAEAKKKMQEDIIKRAAAAELERQAKTPISQEIPEPVPVVDTIPEEEREKAKQRIEQLKGVNPNYPCLTCLSVGHCDGSSVHSVSRVGATEVFACDNYMGKRDAQEVREKATVKVPKEIMELAKEKAGSRAEVLDLNELRAGSYGDLKQGYVLLDNVLREMDNFAECLNTCTKGFHYAFDSRERPSWQKEQETQVNHVCTNPKCVSQKKAAHTRAVNAAGQAKKKAEVAAIKRAIDETTSLDMSRMKVLIVGLIHTSNLYSRDNPGEWFLARLKIDKEAIKGTDYGAVAAHKLQEAILKKVDALSDGDIARLLIEYTLTKMMYQGDIKDYKVQTTEALNILGIGFNIGKEIDHQ